jgi:predicted Zn-dependent peptidase
VPELEPEWVAEGQHYAHRKLPAGDLIAAKNTRNDLFSLTYSWKRGYRKEPLLCHALELFDLSGSGDMSAEALQKKLYALGVTVNSHCDAEYAEITIEGLDAKLEEALAVVNAWIADPKFTDEDVRKLYENTIVRRKDGLEEDWRLSSALDTYAKYDKKSAWLQHPSNAKLAKADGKTLRRLISTLPGWEHRTLYFGTREPDAISKVVAMGTRHKKTGDIPARVYRKVRKPEIFFLHKDGAKANVRFAIPRAALSRDRRPTARLLSEYLSGNMSALVFQEIREARGLAYTASSSYDTGRRPQDATGLLGFMSTQADKTPVAVDTFLGLLRTDQIQAERLEAAKLALDQEYRATRIDPRWITRWVTGWDDMGEKSDPRAWEWQTIGKLQHADLSAFAKQFVGAPVIIGIVGDRTRVDLDALEKIGTVHELVPADLFSYGPFPADKGAKKTADVPAKTPEKGPKPPAKATLVAPKDAKDKPKQPAAAKSP